MENVDNSNLHNSDFVDNFRFMSTDIPSRKNHLFAQFHKPPAACNFFLGKFIKILKFIVDFLFFIC